MDASSEIVLPELADPEFRAFLKEAWEIQGCQVRPDLKLQGSPERALARGVIEDGQGRCLVVERFGKERATHRNRVAKTLAHLRGQGLAQVLAPEKTGKGEYLPFFRQACYQVTRFVSGTELERPNWLTSPDLGGEMARFLTLMRQSAKGLPVAFPDFSLKTYIYKLFQDMAAHCPGRFRQYAPVLAFLEKGFMAAHDRLVPAFCHGDFHPLNVIWQDARITAVIDFEFTGVKPDLYDVANLVGCAGIEHPEGLVMPMVTTFLEQVKKAGLISDLGWRWLPEYVLALRFAWLSEWLRKQDTQMLDMEFRFMEILMNQMGALREIWPQQSWVREMG